MEVRRRGEEGKKGGGEEKKRVREVEKRKGEE